MEYLEVAQNAGEQLSLLGESLSVTDDAIEVDGSLAVAGVRQAIHDRPIIDVEIFYSNIFDSRDGIEVYPIDALDRPVQVESGNLDDDYLKAAVSAVFVARATGKLISRQRDKPQ